MAIEEPAGTSSRLWQAEIRRVVASAEVRDALFKQGADPVTDTPEQFAAIVRADVAKWANIVKQTGVKPN